ncbi:M16 family metallopeptidase [Clostridium vincentii]|uniref:Peptidase M16 inactive domain protein n=1 Tax=Clostridium vincentii TaxID=52704 RepID=A0A2T0BB57_9CLOT|nr:pitrilysin family protein [Clostridium vincentii]PRR81047.1 Peptidase M16 inactive domain protein [Clostridium vincentii]
MKEFILDNGIKLIYSKGTSQLTSISIGLEAGAAQDGEILGLAHATEHMVYKGTKKRSEDQINEELSKLFGFHNAMTNYPYVIYYGTLLGEELDKGVEIFSDLLINAAFPFEGFKEEMDVIVEELKEWDEELDQYCEDKLLFNTFRYNRLKYPIIGDIESLKKIKIEDIENFYKTYYSPGNTSIAVVSSLSFEEVKQIIEKYFSDWKKKNVQPAIEKDEVPLVGIYRNMSDNTNTCKLQIVFPINDLSEMEMKALRIFNEYFGEGINSVLFSSLRTKNGLVYDVLTKIRHEKHIRLYKINFSTSKDKVDKALEIVNEAISNIEILNEEKIAQFIKSIKIKKLFKEEQSIQLAKELSTYSVMFQDFRIYDNMLVGMEKITGGDILKVARNVLKNPSIEIIS